VALTLRPIARESTARRGPHDSEFGDDRASTRESVGPRWAEVAAHTGAKGMGRGRETTQ
jgi:hypothetical protein